MLKKTIRFMCFALIGAFAFGGGFSGLGAYAQGADAIENLKAKLPVFDSVSEQDFFDKTVVYQETPQEDKHLEYKVRLPRDWEKSNEVGRGGFSLSNRVLGEVAKYYSPVRLGDRSYFAVQAHALEYQLTADQWFAQYVIQNGYALQGMNVINDDRIEALYVLVDGDVTFIVRAIAQVNGGRVVLAQHVIPAQAFEEEKGFQEKIVASFELLTPDNSFVENMLHYKFLDLAEFYYPDSWFVRGKKVRTIDRMQADIYRVTKRNVTFFNTLHLLTGKIGVHAISSYVLDDIETQIATFKEEIESTGLVFKDKIEEPEGFVFADSIGFGHVEVHSVVDDKENKSLQDYEFWLAIMGADDYYYFVTLLTPSRNQDFKNWARNSQTFKVVTELVGPQVDNDL